MTALIRLLLIPGALFLWNTAASSRDIPGLPKELIGTFADGPEQCRAFLKKVKGTQTDNNEEQSITRFFRDHGKYYYSSCNGIFCQTQVLSHRAIQKGFILNVKHIFLYGSTKDTLSVTKLNGDGFRFHFSGGEPFKVVRCSRRPFVADTGS
jgi:hypothetical protein